MNEFKTEGSKYASREFNKIARAYGFPGSNRRRIKLEKLAWTEFRLDLRWEPFENGFHATVLLGIDNEDLWSAGKMSSELSIGGNIILLERISAFRPLIETCNYVERDSCCYVRNEKEMRVFFQEVESIMTSDGQRFLLKARDPDWIANYILNPPERHGYTVRPIAYWLAKKRLGLLPKDSCEPEYAKVRPPRQEDPVGDYMQSLLRREQR